jgi:prolyl 4-hydroxylase
VHKKEAENVGNRAATVLFYISDVPPDGGGATTLPLAFPANATRASLAFPPDPDADKQCVGAEPGGMGMAVRPVKGDALLFWDMLPDGKRVDRRALHASCPTVRGVKYTATLWIHSKPYGVGHYDPLQKSGRCEDLSDKCEEWAEQQPTSLCDVHSSKMLGLGGLCRRACRDCAVCAADDLLCLRANGRSRRAELLAWDEERRRKEGEEGGGGDQ